MKEFIAESVTKNGIIHRYNSGTVYIGKVFHGYKLMIHSKENTPEMVDYAEGLADNCLPYENTRLKLAEVYCFKGWLFYRYAGKKRYHIDYFNYYASTNTLHAMEKLILREQALNP